MNLRLTRKPNPIKMVVKKIALKKTPVKAKAKTAKKNVKLFKSKLNISKSQPLMMIQQDSK